MIGARIAIVIWQFTRTGEFLYGCLVAGHFEAGLTRRLVVEPESARHRSEVVIDLHRPGMTGVFRPSR